MGALRLTGADGHSSAEAVRRECGQRVERRVGTRGILNPAVMTNGAADESVRAAGTGSVRSGREGAGKVGGRIAQQEEIAPTYVYLASDAEASFTVGETIAVTGGITTTD